MRPHAMPRRRARPPPPGLVLLVAALACEAAPTEPGATATDRPGETAAHAAMLAADAPPIRACHDAEGGRLYRIAADGAPDDCRSPDHVQVAWTAEGPVGPVGPTGPAGADGAACWDVDRDGVADAGEDRSGDGHFDALDCGGPAGVFGGTIASPDGRFTIVLDNAGIRVRTPGTRLTIDRAGILLDADRRIAVRAATLRLKAAGTARLRSGAGLTVRAAGLLDASGFLSLNGDCWPVARVGDATGGHVIHLPLSGGVATSPGPILTGSPTTLSC